MTSIKSSTCLQVSCQSDTLDLDTFAVEQLSKSERDAATGSQLAIE